MKVDEKGLRSSAAPSAYVGKVRLSRAAMISSKTDTSRGNSAQIVKTKRLDGTTKYQPQVKRLDTASSSEALSAEVEVLIPAISERNNYGFTWIDNRLAREKITLRVIQSTNRNLTEELVFNDYFDRPLRKFLDKYNDFVDYQIQEYTLDKLPDDKRKTVVVKNTTSGNQVDNFQQILNFSIPRSTGHLTYFAVCEIDIEYYQGPAKPHSPVSVERVMDNFELVDRSYFFSTSDGQMWSGPVHLHEPTGYMEGAFHTDASHRALQKNILINRKIQDTTIFDVARSKEVNIFNSTTIPSSLFTDLYITRKDGGSVVFAFGFDHLGYMTSNSKYAGLFQKSNSETRRALLSACPIVDISVIRDKVTVFKGSNRLDGVENLAKTDNNSKLPDIVASSADKGGSLEKVKKFKLPGEFYNKTVEVKGDDLPPDGYELFGSVEEVDIQNLSSFRIFTGEDANMASITDGNYQYSARIQIKDGAKEFIRDKLSELQAAISLLKDYQVEASKEVNYNSVTQKFRRSFVRQQYDNKTYPILNLTSRTNILEEIREMTGPSNVQPWLYSIVKYAETLSFATDLDSAEKSKLVLQSYSVLSPITGRLDDIQMFISMMEELSEKLGGTNSESSFAHTKDKSSISQNHKSLFLNINTSFKQLFDSNIVRDTGFDYLGIVDNTVGLTRVTKSQYRDRVNQELDRYRKNLFTEEELVKEFEFLSSDNAKALLDKSTIGADLGPSKLSIAGKRTDLLSQKVDSLDYVATNSVIQSTLALNEGGKLKTVPDEKTLGILNQTGKGTSENRIKNITEVQQKSAQLVGFEPPVTKGSMPKATNTISSQKILGKDNAFANKRTTIEDRTVKQTQPTAKSTAVVVSKIMRTINTSDNLQKISDIKGDQDISFDLKNDNNFISKRIIPSQKASQDITNTLKNMPQQQKLLTLRKERLYNDAAAKATTNDDTKTDGFIFNFGMQRRVEYLSAFREDFLKSPVWKALTFNALDRTAGSLVCRIRKNNDPNLNLGEYLLFDSIPVNNEYFIIFDESQDVPTMGNNLSAKNTVASKNNSTNLKTLAKGTESVEVSNLSQVISQDSMYIEQIQYTMTQDPIPPSDAFDEISGLGVKMYKGPRPPGAKDVTRVSRLGAATAPARSPGTTATGGSRGGY
jgi:hypothetical protein